MARTNNAALPEGDLVALEHLCAGEQELRATLRGLPPEGEGLLDEVLRLAATAEPITGAIDRLEAFLHGHGHEGVRFDQRGNPPDFRLTGVPEPSADVFYVCPLQVCGRYWIPADSEVVPRCAVRGQPLLRKRQ